jgi:hypothetical protein
VDKLKQHFSDVISGITVAYTDSSPIYIKHFSNLDIAEIDAQSARYEYEAKTAGLPTNKEQEKRLIEKGLWSEKNDLEITKLRQYADNLKVTKTKVVRENQIKQINKEIEQADKKVEELQREKRELLDVTIEGFVNKKINAYYIRMALYSSADLSKKLYTAEEFDDIDNAEIGKLVKIYNEAMDGFTDANLKKVALSPFFLNFFYLCDDDAFKFYGKPVILLTFYQASLFGYARYFKNLISQAKSKPPEDVMEDPDKLVDWCSASGNAHQLLAKNQKGESVASSIPGASKEELERLGIEVDTSGLKKMMAEAAKNGGELGMAQMMKIQGFK